MVCLVDPNGYDIGEELCALELADYKWFAGTDIMFQNDFFLLNYFKFIILHLHYVWRMTFQK